MMRLMKTVVAVSFAVAGLHLAAVAFGQPGQGDPPPPAHVWDIDRPSGDAVINKNSNIACEGNALDNTNFVCAINCLSGGTWSVYNSIDGRAANYEWRCTVNKPEGGSWVVGTDTACCVLHPNGEPSVQGQPFNITE